MARARAATRKKKKPSSTAAQKKPAAGNPVVKQIVSSASEIRDRIVARRKPSLKFPLRSLSNVRYSARKGHFEMLGKSQDGGADDCGGADRDDSDGLGDELGGG